MRLGMGMRREVNEENRRPSDVLGTEECDELR